MILTAPAGKGNVYRLQPMRCLTTAMALLPHRNQSRVCAVERSRSIRPEGHNALPRTTARCRSETTRATDDTVCSSAIVNVWTRCSRAGGFGYFHNKLVSIGGRQGVGVRGRKAEFAACWTWTYNADLTLHVGLAKQRACAFPAVDSGRGTIRTDTGDLDASLKPCVERYLLRSRHWGNSDEQKRKYRRDESDRVERHAFH